MGKIVHLLVRPFVEAWVANSSESWRRLPRPLDTAGVHSPGVNPDQLLLVGGGASIGYGVMSHDLALGGHLARQVSSLTQRGTDVEIRAEDGLGVREVAGQLDQTDLDRFDAVITVLGSQEALQLLPVREFRSHIRTLISKLDSASPRVVLVTMSSIARLGGVPAFYMRAINRRVASFNRIAREECAGTSVTHVDIARGWDESEMRLSRDRYGEWAQSIAPVVSGSLSTPARRAGRHVSVPFDDETRVASLADLDVLGPDRVTEFDEVVEIARNLFGTDTASLNFIDTNYQWVKSFAGKYPGSLSRAESICDTTIQRPGLLVVEDLSVDPRFNNRSWVGGDGGVRFYAGYPIVSPDGQRVGALCLLDSHPRTFSESDHALLRELALRLQSLLADLSKRQLRQR